MGVSTSGLTRYDNTQVSMFSDSWKKEALDNTIDKIRLRYGDNATFRAVFLDSDIRHMIGGTASNRRYPYDV